MPEVAAAELQKFLVARAGKVDEKSKLPEDHVLKRFEETPLTVLDVRTEGEFQGGHLPVAVGKNTQLINCSLFPPWSFRERVQQLNLPKDALTVCICLSAHRSIAAIRLLREEGFSDDLLMQLQGGMQAWREAKLPEEQEQPKEADKT